MQPNWLYVKPKSQAGSLILSRVLCSSWAQRLSMFPISLITRNSLHSASMTFPKVQWADSRKRNSAVLGQGPGSLSRDMMCLVTQWCPTLCNPMDCSPTGSSVLGDSPDKNTRVGCHAFLQGTFPTQGWNSALLHCRRILYFLSHQGSPASDTLDNIFELFCKYWSPLQVGEVKINDGMLLHKHTLTLTLTSDQLEPEGWWCWLLHTSPPTHQKNVHKLITPSLNHETSYYLLQLWIHNFLRQDPTVSPFVWQSNKAIHFYFTQNCLQGLIQHWYIENRSFQHRLEKIFPYLCS